MKDERGENGNCKLLCVVVVAVVVLKTLSNPAPAGRWGQKVFDMKHDCGRRVVGKAHSTCYSVVVFLESIKLRS